VSLLSAADQQKLRDEFATLTRNVRLLFFTQTIGCETCPDTRQILDEFPPLSERITVEEVNLVLDRDKAAAFGIDRAPAVALEYEDAQNGETAWYDSRIRFLGTPAGYEFMSLVSAVLLAGGRPSRLSDESKTRLAGVTTPVTLQVFTTPT
jgi:alkyl hydroperoxide reductase subunit AhpF